MAKIQNAHVKKAKKVVRDKFPEMAGVEPSVSEKRSRSKGIGRGSSSSGKSGCADHFVLTFEKEVSLPGGGRLKRLVRLTLDDSGEVVKLTSSK